MVTIGYWSYLNGANTQRGNQWWCWVYLYTSLVPIFGNCHFYWWVIYIFHMIKEVWQFLQFPSLNQNVCSVADSCLMFSQSTFMAVWVKPLVLTHWGRVTHICIGNLTIIGSDNGLLPGWRQAIIWTNAGILLIRPLETKFSEILISQFIGFHLWKCIWKYRLRNGHFVSASLC